ncbi:unnamed protein product [Cuscuta campestris]|uniref:Uncharacterized protein n=1 Tax=Cuscuta campestris TaxID=132261 RepID=A0A484KR98_9ASTE|nr:unnamed protein product [Cuscuta campestris]
MFYFILITKIKEVIRTLAWLSAQPEAAMALTYLLYSRFLSLFIVALKWALSRNFILLFSALKWPLKWHYPEMCTSKSM